MSIISLIRWMKVILDGIPIKSCIISAVEVAGHKIIAIEGLEDEPIQIKKSLGRNRVHAFAVQKRILYLDNTTGWSYNDVIM